MAVITPDSYVKLLRIELTPDNQLTFSDINSQETYFQSLAGLELEDFTYQRKDNIIRVPQVYETLEKYNYVMYKNPDYSTKFYYAYITNLKYVNDNMTEVTIKTDVFQTWQFDFIYMRSFVEREMVNDDSVGLHTIPEGLETGEYKINSSEYFDELDECLYMVQTTEWVSGIDNPLATNYGGIYMAGRCLYLRNLSTSCKYNTSINK